MVLLGHIDTVPGEISVRVARSPLSPHSQVLFGRGSVDAKGPLSAFVDAVAGCGAMPGWQMVVIGAVGEEQDSPGAQHVLPLYHPEAAIIGGPSGWERVTLDYKGSAWVLLMVRRSLSHTAGQDESAYEAVLRAWETIKAKAAVLNLEREKAFNRLQLSLRGMDSGGDGFEEWASLRVGARLPLDLPPQRWYEQLSGDPQLAGIPGISFQPVGFNIHKSHLSDPLRLIRMLVAARLAYLWMVCQGLWVIAEKKTGLIDRTDRIDKSLFRLGLDWIKFALKRNLDVEPIFRFQPVLSNVNVR